MIVRDSGRGNTPLVWAIEGDREFVVMSPTDGGRGVRRLQMQPTIAPM
jgi:hypothetical protein